MALSGQGSSAFSGDWELLWAPYDLATYQLVLEQLHPEEVVLEIGAGDLRLTRQIAAVAHKGYGIEINSSVLGQGLNQPVPDYLVVLQADALVVDFPSEVTVGVLLMRHCTHFNFYANKLSSLGCQKLITNARWRMGVETIALQAPRIKFSQVVCGWYACWCGAVGFKPGLVELLTPEIDGIIHEVIDCPHCLQCAGEATPIGATFTSNIELINH